MTDTQHQPAPDPVEREARAIRERTIDARVRAGVHQGMDDEAFEAHAAQVREEMEREPLPTPLSNLSFACRHAAGHALSPYDWRKEERYELTLALRKEADRG